MRRLLVIFCHTIREAGREEIDFEDVPQIGDYVAGMEHAGTVTRRHIREGRISGIVASTGYSGDNEP